MLTLQSNGELVKRTIELFTKVRGSIVEAAEALYSVQETGAWSDNYDTFGEFCEQGAKITPGFASKLLKVWRHYAVGGGVSPRNLAGVDSERLYLAINLQGSPKEQLEKAKVLSRVELKQELAVKAGVECQHPEIIQICATCHVRIHEGN